MRKISVKAVILAGILDIVLTNVLAFPVMVAASIQTKSYLLPKAQQTQALVDAFQTNSGIYAAGLLLGSLASVVAGYVAARIARRAPLLNGALSAWLCVASGLSAMWQPHSPLPLWEHLLFLPLSPGLGALGGYWWLQRSSRGSASGPQPAMT